MTKSSTKAGVTEGGHKRMFRLFKSRRALSEVVTTLIILVVSVLLASVVTFYAINVVSTRVQEESLDLVYDHVWYSINDQMAEVAIMITNTGGRDVVFRNIAVRGQSVPVADIFYVVPKTIADLTYVNQSLTDNPAGPIAVGTAGQVPSQLGTGLVFSQPGTPTPITLASGKTIAVYIAGNTDDPGSVTVNDVGLTIAISVFTAQATYYKETNVNAVGP